MKCYYTTRQLDPRPDFCLLDDNGQPDMTTPARLDHEIINDAHTRETIRAIYGRDAIAYAEMPEPAYTPESRAWRQAHINRLSAEAVLFVP